MSRYRSGKPVFDAYTLIGSEIKLKNIFNARLGKIITTYVVGDN